MNENLEIVVALLVAVLITTFAFVFTGSSDAAMLGLFSQEGIDVEEGIERITNMLQGNKKGGSNSGKRS
ncbi:hypothetical protein [Enterococcus phage EFap02]|nr:hypothetical protein [Enterococcus phage EFap02]